MLISTTNDIPGRNVTRHIGLVRGITVRSRSALGNLAGGLQSMFGGKLTVFVSLAETARQEALDHLIQHATEQGANAIIGMRYDANEIMEGITEVLAYGTAVADSVRWDSYRPRPGDIVVVTAPKCGTTWTQMLCALLVHGPRLPQPLTRLSPWLDRLSTPVETLMAELDAQPWRRIIKTHTPLDGLPYFEEVSYVFCGRDPRDAFLSMMDNMQNASAATMGAVRARIGLPDSFAFPTDPNAFFPVWMTAPIHAWVEDGFPIGSVFGAARPFWRHRHLPNLHFTHYRDLSGDLGGEMRRLADFLDVRLDPRDIPRLTEAAGFSVMRAGADDLAPGAHLGEWTDNTAFFAHARLDAWREALNAENQALYEELAPKRASPALRAWLEGGRTAVEPKRV